MIKIKHIISVSGGKDSTATALLALDRCKREETEFVFFDTGNEHEYVYQYLTYLEQKLGITIHRLKADFNKQIAAKRRFIARDQRMGRDARGRKLRWTNKAKRRALSVLYPTGNPFLDLCLWKGTFPSRKAQFCTEELKRNLALIYQLGWIDEGYSVISWQGVRRDESQNRKNAKKHERLAEKLWAFRPLVEWTAGDVFAYCNAKQVNINPLYLLGMGRVGCMPCINCSKRELREIAYRFPDSLEEKAQWERLVSMASKRGFATFFHKRQNEDNYIDRRIYVANSIHATSEWAKTTHGGTQYDLLGEPDATACSSVYGLCE